jgi:Putative auto-transporter adhesin, head GIN domain
MNTTRLHLAGSLHRAGMLALALTVFAPWVRAQQTQVHRGGTDVLAGSGRLQTERRSVGAFSAITLRGAMTLVLRPGQREAVEVRADDNLLALVETRVVDRAGIPTLEVDTKSGASYTTRNEMTVTVDAVTLQALSIIGSGDAFSDGLKTPRLKLAVAGSGSVKLRQLSAGELMVNVSGSGDVEAAGQAARLDVSIRGSGDVRARSLEADDVNVRIAGSGSASVNARKALTVSITGSGDVDYAGDAVVKSSVSGSGGVTKKR